jgi:prepilin-type N-terminal cleavage/methylation domain-containing protein
MPIKYGTGRGGFTLTEMMIGIMISGMVLASLAAIHATSTTHMFQNYRQNTIKNGASFAMKTVMSRLAASTRIDSPAFGASGNILAIAENVDQLTGCHPIRAGSARQWHYFCRYTATNANCPSGSCLMYHTGAITAGGGTCPNGPAWAPSYPAFCGPGGGGVVTRLTDNINVSSFFLFSRRAADGVNERDAVRVRVRVSWTPSVALSRSARPVDSTLDSTGSIQRSVCNSALPGCS